MLKKELEDGVPCGIHRGCLSHIRSPCEGCGRIGGKKTARYKKELNDIVENVQNKIKTYMRLEIIEYHYWCIDNNIRESVFWHQKYFTPMLELKKIVKFDRLSPALEEYEEFVRKHNVRIRVRSATIPKSYLGLRI